MADTLVKQKEDSELGIKKTVRNRTNSLTNTNAIEAMNNRVTDAIEQGFQPHWVLEDTANHLALKAIETEDDKWLEMINYLTTQSGPQNTPNNTWDLRKIGPNSYGKTLKGKKIVLDAMQKLRAKQAKKDKDAIAIFNHQQKELKLAFQKEASILYLKKGEDGWDAKWAELMVRASNSSMSGVVKGEKENIENLRTDFRTITDAEFQDATTNFIKDTKVRDLLDTNFNYKFTERGYTLTEKQEGDLKQRIDSLKNYDKIKEVKEFIADSGELIDKMLEAEKERLFPHVTAWGPSVGLDQAVREQKREAEEEVKNVFIKHLEKQREENNKVIPYNNWEKDAKTAFLDDVKETLNSIIPKQDRNGAFSGPVYENVAQAFQDNKPLIKARDKAEWIKTLRANRSDLESILATGGKLTKIQREGMDYINTQLDILDLSGENIIQKSVEEAQVLRQQMLVTASSPDPVSVAHVENLNEKVIEASQLDKASGGYAIDTFITDSGIRLGERLKAKIKTIKENIVGPEETQVSKDMNTWYKGKLSSYFPGFLPGFLEGALRFDRERKLEKVPEGAVTLVHKATKKARRLIEDLMVKEVKKQKLPYGLWSPKVKRDFADETEIQLKKKVFTTMHLATLKSMMPKGEIDLSPQALYMDMNLDTRTIASYNKEEIEKFHYMFLPNSKVTTTAGKAQELGDYVKSYLKTKGK